MGRVRAIQIDRTPAHEGGLRLLNLGPKSSAWLAAIGIRRREQLRALGPIESCRRLLAAGYPASVLLAYAIEGALTGTHWQAVPTETKTWLRAEFTRIKQDARRG